MTARRMRGLVLTAVVMAAVAVSIAAQSAIPTQGGRGAGAGSESASGRAAVAGRSGRRAGDGPWTQD